MRKYRPLRDILAGLFFISLGMLVDLRFFVTHLPFVLAIAVAVLIAKTLGATGALLLSATPLRVAITAAIGLSQVGEFSFILGRAGLEAGLLSADAWQSLLVASIATMLATPLLVEVAPTAGSWLARRLSRSSAATGSGADGMSRLTDHVVIVGFGVGGRLFARALRELDILYLIIELNGDTVRTMKAAGEPIIYGDATSTDAMQAAGVDRASAVILVLSDPAAATRSVKLIRSLAPSVPIIVRTRYRSEASRIVKAGATVAIAEEIEASLEALGKLLMRLDIPGNVVEVLVERFRGDSGGARATHLVATEFGALPEAIARAPITTIQLSEGDWAMGRTLAELNLHSETGALVVAIKRGGRYMTSPPADLPLQAGDLLYLLGDETDVLLARKRLTSG